MSDSVLGVFVKQPVSGAVKTRLAAALGDEAAAKFYEAFLTDVVDRFRATADRRTLCFAPDDDAARAYFDSLAGDEYEIEPQSQGDLGARLAACFERAFERGAERVVVIGSDSPTLPAALVDEAFNQLDGRRDAVVGPALDGGYYLIGLAKQPRPIFEGIDWSGPQVLEQTIERIREAGATFALLPPWYDVDEVDDLQILKGHLDSCDPAGEKVKCDRTRTALKQWASKDT